MDDHINGNKVTGIRQIVRLREILHKWQAVTIGSSSSSPVDVPKGYLAVYVGPELRRFIIPTSYLSHSLFKVLLEKAEEEFGFDHSGGLTIPCEIETFKFLLKCMEHHPKDHNADDDDDDDGTGNKQ
ncbi:unnamed protein product [Linum tenue]|uniref:Uncharacterized protein n=1 Tax=Linum tenue TaxID=586396 RepID=A0AAV0S3T5_9ROSI|nr:unnamed protein product [Linum tenue]